VWLATTARSVARGLDRATFRALHGLALAVGLAAVVLAAHPSLAGASADRLPAGASFMGGALILSTAALATARATWRGSRASGATLVGLGLLGVLGHITVIVPQLDQRRDLAPAMGHLSFMMPHDGPVYSLRAGETLRALIAFGDGRFVRDVASVADAVAALCDEPTAYLVLDDDERAARLRSRLESDLERVAVVRLDDSNAALVYRARR
jgi:hypothetical protein